MKKRYKMSRRKSRKMFSKGASRTHKFNTHNAPQYVMRGGIRL